MKLIADAGATKVEWVIYDSFDEVSRCFTSGINPAVMQKNDIENIVREELAPSIKEFRSSISHIEFYGAGCNSVYAPIVRDILSDYFQNTEIIVDSDIIGAAKALVGDKEGIVAILGTGSNSCLYDGRKIVKQTPALGYILGDEGSGAVLGKLFINALLKGRLPEQVVKDFNESYNTSINDIIENIYHRKASNKYLASFSTFIHKYLNIKEVEDIVIENFQLFFRNNIRPYGRCDLPVDFVGSVAFYYSEQLRKAAETEGFSVGRILMKPL